MTPITELLQQGAGHAWLFIPSALLLGALHGLEPGHSKTMMAAFIIAIRGTVKQAVLLGLAATFSHTMVVWVIALLGLHYGKNFNAETSEPYLQVASAIIIITVALWMVWRTWREQKAEAHHHHDHGHDSVHRIDTGHGIVVLSIEESGVPPRFHLAFEHHGKPTAPPNAQSCRIETIRPDAEHQVFALAINGGALESIDTIPEPHTFQAILTIGHGNHEHRYEVTFSESDHAYSAPDLDVSGVEYQDPHERAHADDIRRRFASREVTTGQIIVFGLTGGLIPCPAAITILLLCLQLKQFSLGMGLVLCFSIGLAVTMVATGTIAALSVRHASKHFSGFGTFARRAPYFSSALIIGIGCYVGWEGVRALI